MYVCIAWRVCRPECHSSGLSTLSFDTGSLTGLELTVYVNWPVSSRGHPFFPVSMMGLQCTQTYSVGFLFCFFLTWFLGMEPSSLCLSDRHFPEDWTIFLPPPPFSPPPSSGSFSFEPSVALLRLSLYLLCKVRCQYFKLISGLLTPVYTSCLLKEWTRWQEVAVCCPERTDLQKLVLTVWKCCWLKHVRNLPTVRCFQ